MTDAVGNPSQSDETVAERAWPPVPSGSVPLAELLTAFGESGQSGIVRRGFGHQALTASMRRSGDAAIGTTGSLDQLSKADLLGFLLGAALPAPVAAVHAEALLARYGSLGGIMAAPLDRLANQLRSPEAATLLKVLQLLANQVAREPIEERPLIDSPAALESYVRTTMRHEAVEMVRLLFLDAANRLVGEEVHSRGTVNHCPLYPREVVRRVIEMNANALIIVHNHPSGDATPSPQDNQMTLALHQVLARIGVSLHDHLIVGANKNFSYRAHNCLDEASGGGQ